MSYAVIAIDRFALRALLRSDPTLVRKSVALISGEGRKAILTLLSDEVTELEPGCTVTLAMARCPGIILRLPDAGAETEAQRILLAAGFALSPRVESTAPGVCTIDLQGTQPGQSEAELQRQVLGLTKLGMRAQGGIAATPLLANYAAHQGQPVCVVADKMEFLRHLPLSVCQPTPAQMEILRGWGLKTLGDLTTLSKADVGQRLGTGGVALWERAAGETSYPLRLIEPSQSFRAEWLYEPPIDTLEPLSFKLQRYSERIAAELRGSGFVAASVTLTLLLEDSSEYSRQFRLPEPVADAALWMRVFLSHLETVKLDALLSTVQLVAEPARPQHKQDGLFDTGLRDAAAFWENLARVEAIVGNGRIGTPVPADTHRPDTFAMERPIETVPAPEEPPIHPARGLVLRHFRPPWPVQVECTEGRPYLVVGQSRDTVMAAHGPARADGDWWRPAETWSIETWLVEFTTGVVYQLTRHGEAWFVEGVFD